MTITKNKKEELDKLVINDIDSKYRLVKHTEYSKQLMLLESFGEKLANQLKVNPMPLIEWIGVEVDYLDGRKRKRFKEYKENIHTWKFETDDYTLIIAEDNENQIELYWIQVKNKNNGLGTKLVNIVLDIADEMKCSVKTIPSNFDKSSQEDMELGRFDEFGIQVYLTKLREWYKSFGFNKSALCPAIFKYTPSN